MAINIVKIERVKKYKHVYMQMEYLMDNKRCKTCATKNYIRCFNLYSFKKI